MDGLEAFEKNLAAEQAKRERSKRHASHRHHHTHSHKDKAHRSSRMQEESSRRFVHHDDDDEDGDRQRRKRSRRSHEQEQLQSRSRHVGHDDRHVKISDPKADLPCPDEEKSSYQDSVTDRKSIDRDAWMTMPSAIDFESVHRSNPKSPGVPKQEGGKRFVHSREMNDKHLRALNDGIAPPDSTGAPSKTADYTFGDAGSSWRMTKLRAVYNAAEETGQAVEEIALQRYGSLKDFDDAREEKNELERRKIYGEGYKEREKPTRELYHERMRKRPDEERLPVEPQQAVIIPEESPSERPADQTTLNRLRAQMMKAKLRRAPDAAKLEQEYERVAAAAAANESSAASEAVILGVMDSRQLAGHRGEVKAVETKRGRQRGKVEENSDMTIEDMVREERRTRGQVGGEGLRLAERIAKDTKYDNDLDYMDENAEKLAKRVHKNEISLKNMAVNEYQRMSHILDKCPLCYHEDTGRAPTAPVISLATRVYLTLTTSPEVSAGGAVIVPISHRTNLLECDDDEWEEVRNFMKSLMRMYHDQGRDVIFYENAANPRRRPHAAMVAVPIPYEEGATAPAHFKEAFLSAEDEWSQHRKIIDTGARAREGMGRMAFRRSLAKEMPYFHAWFGLDGGLGHIVEDTDRWPRGDLFAREVIGGIVGAEPHIVKKQGRWTGADSRLDEWKRGWRKFDWTRILTEQEAS